MDTSDITAHSSSLRHFQNVLDIKFFCLRHCQSLLQWNGKSVLVLSEGLAAEKLKSFGLEIYVFVLGKR